MTAQAPTVATPPPGALEVEAQTLARRLRWLTLFRVVLATMLLGSAALFGLRASAAAGAGADGILYRVVAAAYLATLVYLVALTLLSRPGSSIRALRGLAYVQLFGDAALSAALVYATGGTDSAFSFFFSLTIINASILLRRAGAFALATASAAILIAFSLGELGVWPQFAPHDPEAWLAAHPAARFDRAALIQTRVHNVGLNTFAFFAVAGLGSVLAEQARRTDREYQRTRTQLEDLEALHRNIVNSVVSGLVTVTRDGRITFFNRVAEQITGLEEGRVVGRHLDEVFPSLRFSDSGVAVAAQYPAHVNAVERIGGQEVHLRWSLSPLYGAHHEEIGHVLFVRDITDVIELEQRMRRAERLAAVGELAARVAHEIRNPLASISASVELLARQPTTSPLAARLMGIVRREVESLNTWIGDFLDYSRELRLSLRPVRLSTLVQEVVDATSSDAPQAEIAFECALSSAEDTVDADGQRLKQVLWNLVRNALEAQADAERPRVSIRVDLSPQGDVARVIVQDWGEGMDEQTAQRIFEPFFTTKPSGTGLGLATSYRLVEAHGGSLRVQSAPGEGACFTLALPRTRAERRALPPSRAELASSDVLPSSAAE